jgi:uncharacterized Zn-binding protein involved in type VI secretion
MFSPVARLQDMHICLMQTPAVVPIPHVGGPIMGPGAMTVTAGGMPVSVLGDIAICVGPPDVMVMGSPTVTAMGLPIVRITDFSAHGAMTLIGMPTVMIGDSGGAGSPQAATMLAAKAAAKPFTRSVCNSKAADEVANLASPKPPVTGTDWIEVEVVDTDGKPLPYQKVRITDSTGSMRTLYSGVDGLVRVEGIAPGTCKITMPDLDESAWKPA